MEITARNVRKSYGGVQALAGVSFHVPAGRKIALIGPNGSGKSTLTRILMGMLSFEGEVLLDGRSPFWHRTTLARQLAYVPQNAPQLAASVADVVNAVSRIRDLEAGDIIDTAAQLDLGLPALALRPVRGLSAGMKQKLMIALALSGKTGLLILDEPTASLDAAARARFFRLCAERAGATTLVLCSHRLEEVQQLVEHVVSLDDGRVVFDGSVADFLQDRALSVLEVTVKAEPEATAWLERHGFSKGVGPAWSRTVSRGEKLSLVRDLVERLDGRLHNLVVRDVETIADDVGRGEGQG